MPFVEPLDVFWSSLDAGLATFTLDDGSTRTVPAYYDAAFFDTQLGENRMETTAPRVTVTAANAAGVHEGLSCLVKDRSGALLQTCTVIRVEPDGTGTAVVSLAYV